MRFKKYKYLYFYVLSVFNSINVLFALNSIQNNIYDILKNNEGWVIYEKNDDYSIYTKNISGQNILATKINSINSIDPEIIKNIIYDISNYSNILKKSPEIISKEIIGQSDLKIGYQYIKINFPFFSDRHYVFEIRKNELNENNNIFIDWELVDKGKYSNDIINCENDCVYLDYGVGIWQVEKQNENEYKYSYCLFMDPGGIIPDFIIDKINFQSILNIFTDVMAEAENRSK